MRDGSIMTADRMEKLAQVALSEAGPKLRVFALNHVQKKSGVWAISFSGKEPVQVEVSVDTHDCNTDDRVKASIRRQLEAHAPS